MEESRPPRQDGNIQHEFSGSWVGENPKGKKGGQEASGKRRPLRAVKVKALERALRH